MNFYVVIILYNKKIETSQSVRNLVDLKCKNISIIVLDNSDESYIVNNKNWANDKHIIYHSMGGNVGLSKAYNYALTLLRDKINDIVIWLDDDTHIKKEYFEVLYEKAKNYEWDVFAPIIYGQDGVIYSPNKVGHLKGHYIKSVNQNIPNDKFNAINSCLAVRIKVYKEYYYDESLFMDCVDTKLFDDFRMMNLKFCVLPIKIYQNFFQRSKQKDVNKYWSRFQIRIKDTVVYSSSSVENKLVGIMKIYGWAIIYGIKLKSIFFFINCVVLGTKLSFFKDKIGEGMHEN